jgi:hypothetical protein
MSNGANRALKFRVLEGTNGAVAMPAVGFGIAAESERTISQYKVSEYKILERKTFRKGSSSPLG